MRVAIDNAAGARPPRTSNCLEPGETPYNTENLMWKNERNKIVHSPKTKQNKTKRMKSNTNLSLIMKSSSHPWGGVHICRCQPQSTRESTVGRCIVICGNLILKRFQEIILYILHWAEETRLSADTRNSQCLHLIVRNIKNVL